MGCLVLMQQGEAKGKRMWAIWGTMIGICITHTNAFHHHYFIHHAHQWTFTSHHIRNPARMKQQTPASCCSINVVISLICIYCRTASRSCPRIPGWRWVLLISRREGRRRWWGERIEKLDFFCIASRASTLASAHCVRKGKVYLKREEREEVKLGRMMPTY